jgi:hypothetical protein
MPFTKGMRKPAGSGRKRGTPNKRSRPEVATKTDAEKIVERIIRKALAGSVEHEKLYLRFLRPRPLTYFGPITFERPRDAGEARGMILTLAEKLASGAIPQELHDALIGDLKVYLGAVAVDKLGLTGKFVVVEGNNGFDLPLPVDDAALAGEPATAPASPVTVEAAVEALDVAPAPDVVSEPDAAPELPFGNILPFALSPPDAA